MQRRPLPRLEIADEKGNSGTVWLAFELNGGNGALPLIFAMQDVEHWSSSYYTTVRPVIGFALLRPADGLTLRAVIARTWQTSSWPALASGGIRPLCPYAFGGGAAGVKPWRRMIAIIFAGSGGPPAAALITSADSRKYCGPIAAGVTTQSTFTSSLP